MVKVFYNNSCNICRAEINHYKKYSNNKLEWIDVTNNKLAQDLTSKSYRELLRRMHVIQDGKVIDGAESFLIIWKNVPKYNFLYKIFKVKPLFLFLKIFYEIAALFLFLKNKHLLKWKKKINLPKKICIICERSFSWRKKWRLNWDKVKYCSKKCSRSRR